MCHMLYLSKKKKLHSKIGQEICITFLYLNSKIIGRGDGKHPPPSKLDKNSTIGIGLTKCLVMYPARKGFCLSQSVLR